MSWRPHLVLLGLAAVMIAASWIRHVPTDEALATAFDPSASTDERIWAMHLVSSRATEVDPRLGEDLTQLFLTADDLRLREAAVLVDLCRHATRPGGTGSTPPLQEKYAYGALPSGWTPHRYRTYVFHRRKVGGAHVGGVSRMNLTECRWLIDAIQGRPLPPTEDIEAYRIERTLSRGVNQPPGRASR